MYLIRKHLSISVAPPPPRARNTLSVQMCLTHASGSLELRHLHPGDWLGRPDSFFLRANAGGRGTYYNPLVDAQEHFIEPWSGLVDCRSEIGDSTTELRVEVCRLPGRLQAVSNNYIGEPLVS